MFLPTVTPETLGFASSRLARLDRTLTAYIEEEKLAGMIMVVARHGQIAYGKPTGWMDREAETPMAMDTIFRIFSMSKIITSVAALMLYEEGHFQLTDPVADYIPGFGEVKVLVETEDGETELVEPEQPIAIWHLLTHTAGLTYGSGETPVDALYRDAQILRLDEPLDEKMARLAELPLRTHPGATWHYSIATDVVGHLVQVVAGMPFETFLAERIFEPLGMADTAFYVPAEKQDRLARVYVPVEQDEASPNGGIQPMTLSEDDPYHAWATMAEPPAFPSGGGGLVASTEDYLRFAEMLRRRGEMDGVRLLGRKTVDLMTMNHLTPEMRPAHDPKMGFGLGVSVTLDVAQTRNLGSVGNFGWSGAASTHVWIDPQEDLVGLLMVQFMPNGQYSIHNQVRMLTYQALIA